MMKTKIRKNQGLALQLARKWMNTMLVVCCSLYMCMSLTSCKDDDDLADPSVRLSEAVTNFRNVLTSAPNGWAMYMYGDEEFGGFNVLCKFENDGKVTVANEMFTAKSGADTTAVTHYKIEQSSGALLSFDEYCELFHYFSDPLNADGYNSTTENGFGADLEFRLISACADSVVMLGKKHGARIVMRPINTTMTWATYLTKVASVASIMQKGSYYMIVGKDSLKMKANRNNRVLTYYDFDEEGNRVSKKLPYVVTPSGITLYKTFDFKNNLVDGFVYADGVEKYKQEGVGGVVLEKFIPTLSEQLVDGVWYVNKEGLGVWSKVRWEQFRNGLLQWGHEQDANMDLVLRYAVFGTWRNRFGLSVGPVSKENPYSVYLSECYFDYKVLADNKIQTWFNGEFDELGNAELFYPNKDGARLEYAVQTFGAGKNDPKTFTIETDNPKDPTYLKLTEDAMPSNNMTLKSEAVYFPFGDGPSN